MLRRSLSSAPAAHSPLFVSVLDWAFLGRELPTARSWTSLLVLVSAAAGYVHSDKEFRLHGVSTYTWVSIYFVLISLEMVFGKRIVGPDLGFVSMCWGATLCRPARPKLPSPLSELSLSLSQFRGGY